MGVASEFWDILTYLYSNAQARHGPDSGDWGHTRPCSNKACCDCDTSKNGVARDLYVQHLTALMHCTRGYSSNQVALAVIARSAADTPVEVPGRKSLKREKVQKFIQVTNLYEKIEKTKTPGSSELHCRTKSFSESKPHRRATKLRWLRSTLSKRRNWSRSHPCLLQSP